MDIQEMHNRVDLLMDRVNSPRFRSGDKDSAINMAIERIVRDRYDNLKIQKKYSFESAQRVRDELRTLIKEEEITTIDDNKFTIPEDYRHEINLFVTINDKSTVSRPTNYDELGPLLSSPFERPSYISPVHLEIGSDIKVYFGDSGSFTKAKISYIKNPTTVSLSSSIDSDIPISLHEEIVKVAASILSGTVQDLNRRGFLEQENGMS